MHTKYIYIYVYIYTLLPQESHRSLLNPTHPGCVGLRVLPQRFQEPNKSMVSVPQNSHRSLLNPTHP